jgi:hypothetical protein
MILSIILESIGVTDRGLKSARVFGVGIVGIGVDRSKPLAWKTTVHREVL